MAQKKGVSRLIIRIDNFQRKHLLAGVVFAVVKKYGEDEAGNDS